jgi:hypothetical protein
MNLSHEQIEALIALLEEKTWHLTTLNGGAMAEHVTKKINMLNEIKQELGKGK